MSALWESVYWLGRIQGHNVKGSSMAVGITLVARSLPGTHWPLPRLLILRLCLAFWVESQLDHVQSWVSEEITFHAYFPRIRHSPVAFFFFKYGKPVPIRTGFPVEPWEFHILTLAGWRPLWITSSKDIRPLSHFSHGFSCVFAGSRVKMSLFIYFLLTGQMFLSPVPLHHKQIENPLSSPGRN